MRSQQFPSVEARRILASLRPSEPDRSAAGLPRLRQEAKARATAEAPRILCETRVTLRETVICDVPCLELIPAGRAAEWPILYGFGGGFVQGSPIEDLPIAAHLCAATGARVIIPDYRLAPEHPWPAPVDDAFAVYRDLARRPLAIVGESAGGNLALVLMQRARAAGLRLPGAAALMSPWCDLGNTGDSLRFNDGRDPSLSAQSSRMAVLHYVGDQPLDNPDISPIYGPFDIGFPPFVITTGTRDLHLSQAVRLSQVLRESGVRADLHVWEGLWHVFEWYDQLPEAKQSIQRVGAHLISNMNP